MSEYVIVRINEKLIPEFQIDYNSTTNTVDKTAINSWSDIIVKNNHKLILIVSANLVFTTKVQIPSKNEEVIRQSIPFSVEEKLANDIEDNHYAYQQISEQNFVVSVIKLSILDKISNKINEYGLKAAVLTSEIFSCPMHKNTCTMCVIDDYVIVNDNLTGTIINQNFMDDYFKLSKSEKFTIYAQKNFNQITNKNANIHQIDTLSLQAKTITSTKFVNLFQGQYDQTNARKVKENHNKRFYISLVILVFSWIGINIYKLNKLSTDIESIKLQQKDLISKLIPNLSQVELNDPYSAMLSRLKISQNINQSHSGSVLIQALAYLGQALKQHPDISTQSLRQRDSKLEVKLQANSISSLNSFQATLEQISFTMRVKTGTRDTTKNGISSIVTLEKL